VSTRTRDETDSKTEIQSNIQLFSERFSILTLVQVYNTLNYQFVHSYSPSCIQNTQIIFFRFIHNFFATISLQGFYVQLMILLFVSLVLCFSFAQSQCILGTQSGCSTAVAIGLTRQIASQLNQMGYTFTTLNATTIQCDVPCINVLQESAAQALSDAAASKGQQIILQSAWRSAAQQYLLYQWYLAGNCGIQIAAKPGTSNHEGGRAIDTSYYDTWRSTLQNYGWQWYGSQDLVHFDYLNAKDLAKQNLIAFQTLWNQNNPNKKIGTDGVYGPDTANALYNSPCSGW